MGVFHETLSTNFTRRWILFHAESTFQILVIHLIIRRLLISHKTSDSYPWLGTNRSLVFKNIYRHSLSISFHERQFSSDCMNLRFVHRYACFVRISRFIDFLKKYLLIPTAGLHSENSAMEILVCFHRVRQLMSGKFLNQFLKFSSP